MTGGKVHRHSRSNECVDDDGSVSRPELIEKMTGCIDEETQADDAEPMDPRELKRIRTEDMPL